jgi:carotenoid cleavage dioxygenase-like enzyme
MYFLWILFSLHLVSNAFLWKLPTFFHKSPILIKDIQKQIPYNSIYKPLISKINGFFGVIGPHIHYSNITDLMGLFIQNGNIQGVFFKDGNISFVRHSIRTGKFQYEENHGKIVHHMFLYGIFEFLGIKDIIPSIFDVANTAFLKICENKIYALYERDLPYQITIDFKNQSIATIGKQEIESITEFSAHAKFDSFNNIIETVNYNYLQGKISYHEICPSDFHILRETHIHAKYVPFVHDFISTSDKIIFTEPPIQICLNTNLSTFVENPFHISLNPKEKTQIHILQKSDFSKETILLDASFSIFHYAKYREDHNNMYIWASMYDILDFSQFQLSGKYRKITICKQTKEVTVETNPVLEKMGVDFPIQYGEMVILSNSTGFVVCDGLEIVREISLHGKYICGEPRIYYVDEESYLIFLTFDIADSSKSDFILVNLKSWEIIEIPLNESLNVGFHSLFLSDSAIFKDFTKE